MCECSLLSVELQALFEGVADWKGRRMLSQSLRPIYVSACNVEFPLSSKIDTYAG